MSIFYLLVPLSFGACIVIMVLGLCAAAARPDPETIMPEDEDDAG